MNKKKAALIFLGAAVICAFIAFHVTKKDGEQVSSLEGAPESPGLSSASGDYDKRVVTGKNRASFPSHPVKQGDPAHEPKNQSEIDWLNRNGYPSQEEIDSSVGGIAVAAEFSADGGYSVREILRAENYALFNPADRARALGFISDAAKNGSMYALEALGALYSSEKMKDPIKAEAYYQASYLRGNWAAGLRVRQYRLTEAEKLMSDMMAHQIIASINRSRKQAGMSALQYDPRPGLDAALLVMAGNLAELKKQNSK